MELFGIVECCNILTNITFPCSKNQVEKWSFKNTDKGVFVNLWRFRGEVDYGSANLLANQLLEEVVYIVDIFQTRAFRVII